MKTCTVDGCDMPFNAKGMCKTHYERLRSGRKVDAPVTRQYRGWPIEVRLNLKSRVTPTGCIEWTGPCDANGYGKIKYQGRTQATHRLAFEHFIGPIPEGLELDHLCRNRRCMNVRHLEPVTRQENVNRGFSLAGINSRKTACHRGHYFTPDNTIVHSDGRRECRACIKWRAHVARLDTVRCW